ncbi:MAG: photosynthetic complex assembly protein [Paracoccaceae bacterium]|nr:MAG: photosynthetic complex assembly protein [Paracoccaceae bacterium]
MATFDAQPALKHRDREMIPRVLLRAMAALVAATLAVVSFAVLTGRDTVGQPAPAAILSERTIALIGGGAQAVTVLDADGNVLADLAHGGFVTVVQNGLMTTRRRHGLSPDLPVRLVAYANNRLAIEDPLTGWSVELYAFGGDNRAAFERLLAR